MTDKGLSKKVSGFVVRCAGGFGYLFGVTVVMLGMVTAFHMSFIDSFTTEGIVTSMFRAFAIIGVYLLFLRGYENK